MNITGINCLQLVAECPNPEDEVTTSDSGFIPSIEGPNEDNVPASDILDSSGTVNEFCGEEYFTLKPGCEGGLALIMKISIDVQFAKSIKISLLDSANEVAESITVGVYFYVFLWLGIWVFEM